MRTHPRRARWLIGGAAIALGLTAIALPAQAHNVLAASTPAADSTIDVVPEAFSVTTNDALLDLSGDGNGFAIQVIDAAGAYYGDGCAVVAGATLSMGATLGEAGPYRFLWQVVSADGHTVSGEFAFTWAPAADAEISPGSPTPPVCGEPVVEETPTPTPTPEPSVEPTEQPIDDEASSGSDTSAALGIGGAVVAVLLAGGIVWLVIRRRA
jgi:methionine-rich copper-binding protein CopC